MSDKVIAFPALRFDAQFRLWYAGRSWRNPIHIRDNCPPWHWAIMVHRDLKRRVQHDETVTRSGEDNAA